MQIYGYILAGGKSSRMGSDKGLKNFQGEPLITRAISALENLVMETIIITNNPEYEKFGLPVLRDKIKGIGPAGGIQAALNDGKGSHAFILACDMPYITSESAKFVIGKFKDQITLITINRRLEPLFGIYTKDCLEKWNELIDAGIIKLQDMIKHFKLNEINADSNPLADRLFTNLNTLSEFDTENKIKHAD